MAGGSNRGKHHQRTIDRMHILIRLELANPMLNSTEIAQLAGISIFRFSIIKKSLLYQQIHNQYISGIVTRLDKKVDTNLQLTKETLGFAVPLAMQALLKQAMQEKDLRVQNKAANDILDRDGHFAKVTRVGLATQEQGGAATAKDNDEAAALIQALKTNNIVVPKTATIITPPPPTIDSPSASDKTQ